MATTQIIGADGQPYEIPAENLNAALAIPGTKRAVAATGPDGKGYWLPSDKVQEALTNNGFRLGQPAANAFEDRAQNDPEGGGLTRLGRGLGAMVTSPALLGPPGMAYMAGKQAVDDYKSIRATGKLARTVEDEQRKAAGRGIAYRLDAAAATGLGVNVPAMERAADIGNTGGVLGETAVVPSAMALTYGLVKGAPKLASGIGKVGGMVARQAIEDTLRPAPKMFRFGKDPTGFVLENNITGNSLPELHENINAAVEGKISQLNDVLNKATRPVDIAPAAQGLADAIARAKVQRNVPLVQQLTKLYNERFSGRPMQVSAVEAAEIKRGVQDSISWDSDSPRLGAVKKQLQHDIGQQIYKTVPNAAPLSEQISSGIEASKAAERQVLRGTAGKGPAIVRPAITGALAGGALGIMAGGPEAAMGAGGMAAANVIAENAMRSPAVATRVARGASALQRGGAAIGAAKLPATQAAIAAPVAAAASRSSTSKPLDKASAIRYFKAAGGNVTNYSDPQILEKAKQLALADGYDTNRLTFNPQELSLADLF